MNLYAHELSRGVMGQHVWVPWDHSIVDHIIVPCCSPFVGFEGYSEQEPVAICVFAGAQLTPFYYRSLNWVPSTEDLVTALGIGVMARDGNASETLGWAPVVYQDQQVGIITITGQSNESFSQSFAEYVANSISEKLATVEVD